MERNAWRPTDIAEEKQRKKKERQQQHNADHMQRALAGEVPPVYKHMGQLEAMQREGGKQAPFPDPEHAPGKMRAIATFGRHTYEIFDALTHRTKKE